MKDLDWLIQLQEVDNRIYGLEQSKKEFPKKVEELESEIQKAADRLTSEETAKSDILNDRKNFENQIEEAKVALERSEGRLNSITTNREYDAVHSEIETHKNLIANSAQRIKNIESGIERIDASIEEAKKEQETVADKNNPQIDELKGRISSIDSDIADALSEREKIIKEISVQSVRIYNYIHKRRKNAKVIGFVSESDRVCSICYKVLEPQLVNEVRKGNKLHLCQGCGSILIWNRSAEDGTEKPPAVSTEEA